MSQINPDVKWLIGVVLAVVGICLGVFGGWQLDNSIDAGFQQIQGGFQEIRGELSGGFREIREGLQRVEKAQLDSTAAAPESQPASTDFGVDDGPWANDDQCDDSRFVGDEEYLFDWPLGEYDGLDATDCRELEGRGIITWADTP